MKTNLLRSLVLLLLVVVTPKLLSAQFLIAGSYSGSNELLLGSRYQKIKLENDIQDLANYVGIPSLASTRNGGNPSRVGFGINYGTSGTVNFSMTYNVASNSFVVVTTSGSITNTSTYSNVSGRLVADGKTATAATINMMTLAVRTQNSSSTILVSNLTVNGFPISGSYGRNRINGTSAWYVGSPRFSGGFVLTGRLTLSGNINEGSDYIEFNFGNSPSISNGLLPVVWGGFTGQALNTGANRLQWNTLQENNTSHFDIQRSADGRTFQTIGMMFAAGSAASTSFYQYEDKTAGGKEYYYRLSQVDLDGRQEYSVVIKIGASATVQNTATVRTNWSTTIVSFGNQSNRTIRLLDMNGRTMQTTNGNQSAYQLNTTSLPAGMYIIIVTDANNQTETHRFVK